MLKFKKSLLESWLSEILIYHGVIEHAGKKESIAISYNPEHEELEIYKHNNTDKVLDVTDVDISQQSRQKFIISRLLDIASDYNTTLNTCTNIINHYRSLPNGYTLVMSCHFPKTYWQTLFIIMDMSTNANCGGYFDPMCDDLKSAPILDVVVSNAPITYPKLLKGLTTDVEDNDSDDSSIEPLMIHSTSHFHAIFWLGINNMERYKSSYNGYTIKAREIHGSFRISLYVEKDNTHEIFKIHRNHLMVGYYLALLDDSSMTDIDKKLFDIVISNSIPIVDEKDFYTDFETLMRMMERYIKLNSINYNTLHDILATVMIETSNTCDVVISSISHKTNIETPQDTLRRITLATLFATLIRDVKDIETTKQTPFRLVK